MSFLLNIETKMQTSLRAERAPARPDPLALCLASMLVFFRPRFSMPDFGRFFLGGNLEKNPGTLFPAFWGFWKIAGIVGTFWKLLGKSVGDIFEMFGFYQRFPYNRIKKPLTLVKSKNITICFKIILLNCTYF